jgi:hypothetical protein
MMLNEAQEAKWGSLLEAEGLDPIKDNHKRYVTGVLLENQEKALQEAAPVNVATGVAGYDPVLIGMVRRATPHLIAFDVCGVQPMTLPTGLVFAMKSRYTNQSGTEALFNEADTSFAGQGVHGGTSFGGLIMSAALTSGSANVTVTSTAKIAVGAPVVATGIPANATVLSITNGTVFVLSANATATNATATINVGISVGSGLSTATGEGDITAKMGFSIEKVSVTAETYQLTTGYSVELAQDMKNLHGLDAEAELSNILSTELLIEQNRRVLRTIYNVAKPGAQKNTATPGVFNLTTDSDGRWSNEKFKGLLFSINRDANAIALDVRLGRGNILICSADVASALAAASMLSYTPNIDDNLGLGNDWTASTYVGMLNGQLKVYVDPYATDDFYVVGFKGSQYQAGLFFCPYVAAQLYRATDPASFQPLLGMKQRYGMVANPLSGSLSFRQNGFYRSVIVENLI